MVEVKHIRSIGEYNVPSRGLVKQISLEDSKGVRIGDNVNIDGVYYTCVGVVHYCSSRVEPTSIDILVKEATP